MTKTHLKWFGHVRRRATIEAPQYLPVEFDVFGVTKIVQFFTFIF